MTFTPDTSLAKIVSHQHSAALLFDRYGLDFCCRGGQSLRTACEDKDIDCVALIKALDEMPASTAERPPECDDWPLELLIDFIVQHHHGYVRKTLPTLVNHCRKVNAAHATKHPYLPRVMTLVLAVNDELQEHMQKEEVVLFPYIKGLALTKAKGVPPPEGCFATVQVPIQMMESEHENAGDATAEIRSLTNDFTPPPGACVTHTALLNELKEFEHDLHRHIHRENNILHPKAIALEAELNPEPAGDRR
jgi:regulator of cell morphogenesis and NO signaling